MLKLFGLTFCTVIVFLQLNCKLFYQGVSLLVSALCLLQYGQSLRKSQSNTVG